MKRLSNQHKNPFSCVKYAGIIILTCLLISKVKAQNHLLLSEITLQTNEAEFIEIYNPTSSVISLENYYLADNQEYPYLPGGGLPALDVGDFVVRFPAGSSINSNQAIVVARNGSDFEIHYGQKADYEIFTGDAGTADMIIVSNNSASLSNSGEGIALFEWNGSDAVVKDVDLMNAGIPTANSEIVDKSSIAGYLPDAHTMPFQDNSPPAGEGYSTKRILPEGINEIHTGGNGIKGDDETSEDISLTWDEVYTAPTPGSTSLAVSGIETISGSGIMLRAYPNPSSSEIILAVETRASYYTIRIINSQGAVVKTIPDICAIGNLIQINTSEFESGIYYIMVQSDRDTFIQKVILVKNH